MATISRTTAATAYASAITAFRTARANLAAADLALGKQGFGDPVEVVDLRHAVANPNESGSVNDDLKTVFAANSFTA